MSVPAGAVATAERPRGPAWLSASIPALALIAVGIVDYLTGPLLAFFPFYVCVLVVISLRRPWPVAMMYGGLAALIFLVVDLSTVPALVTTVFPYWRALGQLMNFSLVTFVVPKLLDERREFAVANARLHARERELYELNQHLLSTLDELTASRGHQDLVARQAAEVAALGPLVQQAAGRLGGTGGNASPEEPAGQSAT